MGEAMSGSSDSITVLDLVEARSWATCYRCAAPDVTRELGVGLGEVGGATLTCLARIDVLACNRAIGLGLRAPATVDMIDEIVHWYRARAVPRVFLPLHPLARPSATAGWLLDRGFRFHNNWVKFQRSLATGVDRPETDLVIEEIGPGRAATYGAILVDAFSFPGALGRFFGSVVGQDGWRCYVASTAGQAVATAALYVHDDVAELAFAGTRLEARGHGAQRALIARRLLDARAMGCVTAMVETAEDLPARPSASNRNIRHAGFEVAYVRPNYRLDLTGGSST